MIATAVTPTQSRAATAALWTLQIVIALAFLASGSSKIAGTASMVQLFDAVGVGQWFRFVTGAIEIGGALLVLVPSLALFGAAALAGTMIGAIATHLLILHNSPALPVVLLVLTSAVVWLRRSVR